MAGPEGARCHGPKQAVEYVLAEHVSLGLSGTLRDGNPIPAMPQLHQANDVRASDSGLDGIQASQFIRLPALPHRADRGGKGHRAERLAGIAQNVGGAL